MSYMRTMRRKKIDLKPKEEEFVIKREYVQPKTNNQIDVIKAINNHKLIIIIGPAGTGKTHLAVGCGIEKIFKKEFDKLVITRSIVEAGENMGALPGTLEDKISPFLLPIFDELGYFINRNELNQMLANGRTNHRGSIEIAPVAYLRGRTFKNSFIIVDEGQNLTKEQLKMILTRLGTNSKMVITGDLKQSDIGNRSGLEYIIKVLYDIKEIAIIHLKPEDIQRDSLVGKILERL